MQIVIQTLSRWYNLESRDLPWRRTHDPYCIWVSEIILQQTRVAQGLAYYERFIAQFPNIKSLAAAQEAEVLKLWQGLGYYSRARNLHKAAKMVVDELGGVFPSTFQDIQQLPGVGFYTAAAIASFAFGEKVPAIDGNVKRVGARFFGLTDEIQTQRFLKKLFPLLQDAMAFADANEFNQAMIELGATLCSPTQPKCEICPLASTCIARLQHLQKQLPVVQKKQKPVNKYFYFLDFRCGDYHAIVRRSDTGIWSHLHEFPLYEGDGEHIELSDIMKEWGVVEKIVVEDVKTVKHQLTHQTIHAKCWYLCLPDNKFVQKDGWMWLDKEAILLLPLHRLMEKMIKFT
ncbi:MAG: A/G-specific adenine glycosylase [Sphingomonadales bacterium]|nr:A/G-specific adenine glycosylase [Sphingomonadales bacterium]